MTTTTAPAPRTSHRPDALTRADGGPVRVLVVGDDDVAHLLCTALRYEGWRVERAAGAAEGRERAVTLGPDVVLLDAELADAPDALDGVRAGAPDAPVLLLAPQDAVADPDGPDVVAKPFGVEDVVARLRGLLRRSGAVGRRSDTLLTVGDLCLDEDTHEVWRGGDPVRLTATEFELLRYLMRNPRRVLSKPQILDRVWQYDFGGHANIVELYISYLRRKIDRGRAPMIHTVRGAGYVLRPATD